MDYGKVKMIYGRMAESAVVIEPVNMCSVGSYMQGTHSICIFKFPVFSLSDRKFSLRQFT